MPDAVGGFGGSGSFFEEFLKSREEIGNKTNKENGSYVTPVTADLGEVSNIFLLLMTCAPS